MVLGAEMIILHIAACLASTLTLVQVVIDCALLGTADDAYNYNNADGILFSI